MQKVDLHIIDPESSVPESPDRIVYDNAAAIFQITSACNRRCKGCYSTLGSEELDEQTAHEIMDTLPKDSIISLRGGEPTMRKGWYKDFVKAALNRELKVLIDSNGWFINSDREENSIDNFDNPNIVLRISFDHSHLNELTNNKQEQEFIRMAKLASEAKSREMNLLFTCLGMDNHQIDLMLDGTPLEKHRDLFVSLDYYSDIREVQIQGIYVDVNGEIHENLKE